MKQVSVVLAVFICLLSGPARAAMSEWTEVEGGAVRLIADGPMKDGHYRAGLEFLLEAGWHTYWRYPGEAGIPPQISIEGSANVKDIEVLYPAPERYSDGFSESIVYHDGVVLPLRIVPAEPDRAVSLQVEVFFGICNEICVPGEAALSLQLSGGSDEDALAGRLIQRDLDRVPRSADGDGLHISSVTQANAGGSLTIEARVGEAADLDLFAAGPEGSYIGLPKPADRNGGLAVWTLSTKGLATKEADATLRFVLTADGKAIEHLEPVHPDWSE
ncbi:MAG: protein-disulfide reductase DsbD family protein [Roseibium sp.]